MARRLLDAGFAVRALTRDPDSPKARALAELGARPVRGDMNEPDSLAEPLRGVDAVFSVQDFYGAAGGFAGEVRQGSNLIGMAARQGVGHIVQSTMADAPGADKIEHFRSKFEVEKVLLASGSSHTMIGTVWFMDNLLNPKMGGLASFPFLAGALSRDTRVELLAVEDIGEVVARVLTEPGRFDGRRIELAGDRLTVAEMKATFRAVTGRRPPPLFIPRWLGRRLSPEFAAQLAWQERAGWRFSLEEARELWPRMQTFESFLRRHRARFARGPGLDRAP